jgi:hypothetical protein
LEVIRGRQRLGDVCVVLRLADVVLLQHVAEHGVAACHRGAWMRDRVVLRGRGDHSGK